MSVIYSPIRSPIRSPIYSAFGSGPSYDLDAIALFERFTTPADDTRKGLINSLIVALKAGGIWSKLDALYVMAAHDAQAARRNWIADQYNLTAVSSPTFTADRGYAGDGSTSYLDTGAVHNALAKYAADIAHVSAWSRTSGAIGTKTLIGVAAGTQATYIYPLSSSSFWGAVNSGGGQMTPSGSTVGDFLAQRISATELVGYRDGEQAGTATPSAPGALSATTKFTLLARNNTAGNYVDHTGGQVATATIGASLSAGEVAALHAALSTYLQAVGAA